MFNRPPRIQKHLPVEKIDIPAPENLPTKPTIDWFMVGLPILGIGAVIGLSIWLSRESGGLGFSSYLIFLPFMLASVLASVFTYFSQTKQYKQRVEEIKVSYRQTLQESRDLLQERINYQRDVLEYRNPNLQTCLSFSRQRFSRLGERRTHDNDFLTIRLGIGNVPSLLEISAPSPDSREKEMMSFIRLANELKSSFATINSAPVIVDLKETGCLGIGGHLERARELTQSMVVHLCTHHWLEEVNVAVLCGSAPGNSWEFTESLPHRPAFIPKVVNRLNLNNPEKDQILKSLEIELRVRREKLLSSRYNYSSTDGDWKNLQPIQIIIFDDIPADFGHSAIVTLLQEGPSLGVFGIFVTGEIEDIPGKCGGIIEIGYNMVSYKLTGEEKVPFEEIALDQINTIDPKEFATNLNNIDWILASDLSIPPEKLSLLELYEFDSVEKLPLEKWWDEEHPAPLGHLKAMIGKFSQTDSFIIDLNDSDETINAHGPHGFIGGATGSGKSELLRTLVLSLAMTHHPYDVNFALIDYKGGAAFDELDQLPHVVGVITNIEENEGYATRVIEALVGEMRTRERILKDAFKKHNLKRPHIKDYRELSVKRPLPRLIIIFDEFAEFRDRHPKEADDLISIVRKGRALGIHLILATQNPMFALTSQVQQNARFRIALSVNSPDVSREIIDIPDAYNLPPGRGYFKVFSPQLFQTAFVGGSYKNSSETEARAIISQINNYFSETGLSKPPQTWDPPLDERIYLNDLLKDYNVDSAWQTDTWNIDLKPQISNLLGLFDYPAKQQQDLFEFGKSGSGHLIIAGAPGSGKTTALLTIAASIATLYTPDQVHIYTLDCSGQNNLGSLIDFPHLPTLGGCVSLIDKDQVAALFNLMRLHIAEYNQRKTAYRILFLIDNYKFSIDDHYPEFNAQLDHILTYGPSAGIQVVITLGDSRDMNAISNKIPEKITLRQSDPEEYRSVMDKLVPKHLLYTQVGEAKRPGWGLINFDPVLELQIALPAEGIDIDEYEIGVRSLGKRMLQAWQGERAPNIPVLPDHVWLNNLNKDYSERNDLFMPLGIQLAGLAPIGLAIDTDGPVFYFGSTDEKKGKSTLLISWMIGLSTVYPKETVSFSMIAYHNKKLGILEKFSHMANFISSPDQMNGFLESIEDSIQKRETLIEEIFSRDPSGYDEHNTLRELGYQVIVIDDYYLFTSNDRWGYVGRLADLIERGLTVGYRLIISERIGLISNLYDELVTLVRKYRCGVMLGGSTGTDLFTDTQLPYGQATYDLPPGRGYLGNQGRIHLFHSAAYWEEGQNPGTILEAITEP